LCIQRYGTKDENDNFVWHAWWHVTGGLVLALFVFYVLDVVREMAQFLGYHSVGFFFHYVADWWNWVDFLTIFYTAFTLFSLNRTLIREKMDEVDRQVLAVMIFWRWIHMTKHYVTGTTLGPVVLPILKAAGEIRGFFFVVGVSLVAFFSSYVTLVHEYPLWVIFFSAYRTAIFGDGALEDVQDESGFDFDEGYRVQDDLYNFPTTNAFMSVMAFCLGVVLMNIFIAVLSINYERQYKLAWTSFVRSRATATADMAACARGFDCILWRLFGERCISSKYHERKDHDHGPSYLWISCDASMLDAEEGGVQQPKIGAMPIHHEMSSAAGDSNTISPSFRPSTATTASLRRGYSNRRSLM